MPGVRNLGLKFTKKWKKCQLGDAPVVGCVDEGMCQLRDGLENLIIVEKYLNTQVLTESRPERL